MVTRRVSPLSYSIREDEDPVRPRAIIQYYETREQGRNALSPRKRSVPSGKVTE